MAAFGLDLRLTEAKPPALHDRDGYIDFGPAGGSYYYSRTAMDAAGTVTLGDRTLAVTGDAWFDHQWGDFISVGAGGWDWFAVNLDDGTDITLSLVRAADGSYPLVYGTLVDARGAHAPPGRGGLHRGGHRRVDEPRDRRRRTRRAGRSASRARSWRSASRPPSRSRSWTRAPRPASCTGRARSA